MDKLVQIIVKTLIKMSVII